MAHGIEETIARGICIGCGACSVATGGAVRVTLSRHRLYQADIRMASDEQVRTASRVCPFSDEAVDEDQLGAPALPPGALHDRRTGSYTSVFAGRVADDDYLLGSSSGGLTSWTLQELLQNGDVDGVVHVGRTPGEELFGYRISTTIDQLRDDRKSRYYATTLRDVMEEVRDGDLRVALVGVPCFIKAARLLARETPEIASSIAYYVGLVCGHLKSQFFAESMAWQTGVSPERLSDVDFRVKNPGRSASSYDFSATDHSGDTHIRATASLAGGSWGHGAFQPEACNFCDDIFAETADIVFGDAWLPEYKEEWRGTNVVVSRNARLDEILAAGADSNALVLDTLTIGAAAQTQDGNFRHRRQGLAVRLADDLEAGLSVPRKRVQPDSRAVLPRRRRLIRQRRMMSRKSIEWFSDAKTAGSLTKFTSPFGAEIKRYNRISRGNPLRRTASRAKRLLLKR